MLKKHEWTDDVLESAKKIRLMVFDVDGVLTDGGLFFGDDGQEYKSFNSLDGHGIKMLRDNNIPSAIITGRISDVVTHRAKNLGIKIIYQGQHDKASALHNLLEETGLQPEQLAYVGDDIVDLPAMRRVGLAIAVNNAHPLVIEHSHWQTTKNGGHGAAREIAERLLEARGLLQQEYEKYLK